MTIKDIYFKEDYIYGIDESGKEHRQSLLWYPKLRNATDEQRSAYRIGFDGIHWRDLDEDISFESFWYEDAEPTNLQRFFLTHKEINVAEFAKSLGLNASLLRNYINGFKKPSVEREKDILAHIHKLGREMLATSF
ncbi:MAG: DUF2442 domain-containing protein [Bacteroidaceae bacterium]|jgi:hypothetical protein|nr:DUF2442 domain-containing protein [Bacteroidaceae bacterium]